MSTVLVVTFAEAGFGIILVFSYMSPPPLPHPPLPKGGGWGRGGHTFFWDGSYWRRGPLCHLNTLWNILIILGRNEEQDKMTCSVQE